MKKGKEGKEGMENVRCPRCKSDDVKELKNWILKGRGNPTKITIYLCRNCGRKFRKGKRA